MNRSNPDVSPVEREDAKLEVDPERGRLVDASGRDVVLRGLNTGGRSKWPPFHPYPVSNSPTPGEVEERGHEFFGRIGQWGFDTVRLPFSWEALEPERGDYDEEYRARYRSMIDAAWAHGICSIVDFHQDIFAAPFCGDGFPIWAVPESRRGPPRRDHSAWFFKYAFDPDVREAFERFWNDDNGLRQSFREMWTSMASAVGDHPGVVGFEPINEPGWGTTDDIERWKRDVLTPFYSQIRSVIRDEAPDALVFYDAPGVDALYPTAASHIEPAGEGIVFAPHFYDDGLIRGAGWSGTPPEPVVERFAEFRDRTGIPILLGEFGVGSGAHRGQRWLQRLADAIDRNRISATLWEYSDADELWNAEDLNVVAPDGGPRPTLETYVRPWMRAVAGRRADFEWDTVEREGWAEWLSTGGVTEIEVPAVCGDLEHLEVAGTNTAATWDENRREIRIRSPEGALAQVTFALGDPKFHSTDGAGSSGRSGFHQRSNGAYGEADR